jgi:hypothetical protein
MNILEQHEVHSHRNSEILNGLIEVRSKDLDILLLEDHLK